MSHKKSLPKYFAEFFVLFIAVFMGFIAENFRENLAEKKQESMLMKSLMSDLKADSTRLQEIIEENNRRQNALDSFIEIRHLDFRQKSNLITFYEVWKPIQMWNNVVFEPTMVTLNQLESTGVLSSTRETVAASIASYNVSLEMIDVFNDIGHRHTEQTMQMMYDLTDYRSIWNTPPEYPPLLYTDYTLRKFFNHSTDLMWTIGGYVGDLRAIQAEISELINLIRTEYDL